MAYKEIPLTQGKVTIVDAADYDWLNQWKWHITSHGYASRDPKTTYLHRFILNAPKGMWVDHINGDRLDNRRCNLRICTRQENLRNQKKQSGRSSKYKGVCWHNQSKCWMAYIKHNKVSMNLGCYKKEEDAACAYNEAATRLFGEFAKLNCIT